MLLKIDQHRRSISQTRNPPASLIRKNLSPTVMARPPGKRKASSIGRRYKNGTHGNHRKYDKGRVSRDDSNMIGPCMNYNGRTGLPKVATQLQPEERASSQPSKALYKNPKVQLALRHSMPTAELNTDAYLVNKNGKARSNTAARKAVERDVKKIITVINSIPVESQRALALRKALSHLKTSSVTQIAGCDP